VETLAPSIFHLLVGRAYISPSLYLHQLAVWLISGGPQTTHWV